MIATMTSASTRTAGSVGVVETQYADLPAPVPLDCGRELPVRVAYETYGTLSPERDNVLLVCHALSGDAHAALSAIEALAMKAVTPEAKAEQWMRAARLLETRGDKDSAIERYKLALDANLAAEEA